MAITVLVYAFLFIWTVIIVYMLFSKNDLTYLNVFIGVLILIIAALKFLVSEEAAKLSFIVISVIVFALSGYGLYEEKKASSENNPEA